MAEKFVSERNLKFLLYETFDMGSLTRYPYYAHHNQEIFDMVIKTAMKMGRDLLKPHFEEMDKNPPQLVDGQVKVHPSVRTFMKECGEGGWIASDLPLEQGGQQLPHMISFASGFIFSAANFSASAYTSLTSGATRLISSFGNDYLKETYMPKMLSGEWQGTMALTEPQAGSSLAYITTKAEPSKEGYYRVQGQKLFISASDHDGVENIVHLMLARIKGGPVGVKGISLFVVPKKRLDEKGELVFNDVHIAGLYHKLGYRGTPITQLSLGENNDCRGYLVGEPNKGLIYMFQMMNGSRLEIGLCAAATASAAYYAALQYSKERLQGRKLTNKDPSIPQIPIIEHPDVKRMLIFQRSVVEGSLSLLLQCAKYSDLARVLSGKEREKYELLLDLLTPVAKSYPSEMGILSVSQGLQCLGGYGYCDEFPLEQYFRDIRIHPIHEGTTGIQALDLLGRKVIMKEGVALKLYFEEVQKTISEADKVPEVASYARELSYSLEKLQDITSSLVKLSREKGREVFLADATLYLEFFGIICIAWQWLVQALVIQKALKKELSDKEEEFYRGKFYTFLYFYKYELPKIEGLYKRLKNSDGLTVEMHPEYFND